MSIYIHDTCSSSSFEFSVLLILLLFLLLLYLQRFQFGLTDRITCVDFFSSLVQVEVDLHLLRLELQFWPEARLEQPVRSAAAADIFFPNNISCFALVQASFFLPWVIRFELGLELHFWFLQVQLQRLSRLAAAFSVARSAAAIFLLTLALVFSGVI